MPNILQLALAAMVGACGIGLLLWRRPLVVGTTLTLPWTWAAASLAALAGVECGVAVAGGTPTWAEPLRFIAAASTFCPVMGLVGARRPHAMAWNIVVATLWAVLALPAWGVLVFPRGHVLDVHGAQICFVWVLIVVSLVNSGPTRFAPAGLLFAAGQVVLLHRQLVAVPALPIAGVSPLAGAALCVAAGGWAAYVAGRRPRGQHALDRLWLEFRDLFGTLWALRAIERFNAAATLNGWCVRLVWRGFQCRSPAASWDQLPSAERAALEQSFRNLLRRFVSPEWIASRLREPLD